MKITRKSPFTGIEHTRDVLVSQRELNLWQSGTMIQNAMPNVSAEDREFIKTGITPEEWNETFSDEEE